MDSLKRAFEDLQKYKEAEKVFTNADADDTLNSTVPSEEVEVEVKTETPTPSLSKTYTKDVLTDGQVLFSTEATPVNHNKIFVNSNRKRNPQAANLFNTPRNSAQKRAKKSKQTEFSPIFPVSITPSKTTGIVEKIRNIMDADPMSFGFSDKKEVKQPGNCSHIAGSNFEKILQKWSDKTNTELEGEIELYQQLENNKKTKQLMAALFRKPKILRSNAKIFVKD